LVSSGRQFRRPVFFPVEGFEMSTPDERLSEIGAAALESIREMVEALQADRERLEELRDERDNWDAEENDGETWEECNPDDSDELSELIETVTLDGEEVDEDEARQRIEEDPLSAEVRSGWTTPGEPLEPAEYCLLLTTGGPAVRIVGSLEDGKPDDATLEVQDWGTPWTFHSRDEVLLTYARCFCFAW